MLALSLAASWATMYRFSLSRSDSALGRGQLSLGAPRIHGELLKLGISISERTDSRYLRGRPPTRSQTWRTFVTNHVGDRTFLSPLMIPDARDQDVAVNASDLASPQAPLSIDGSCSSIHWASVDWRRSLEHTLVAWVPPNIIFRTVQARERAPAGIRPRHLRLQFGLTASGERWNRHEKQTRRGPNEMSPMNSSAAWRQSRRHRGPRVASVASAQRPEV
jgi:hypothetical protein